MIRKRCIHCKGKLPEGARIKIHAECIAPYADAIQAKAERKQAKAVKSAQIQDRRETKQKLEKLKTRRDYIKEAQVAFNAYIRERDSEKPCICCGLPLGAGEVGGVFDCGHYRSVGSAPHLRFHEDNAHAQRKVCNRWGAGRAVDYRLGLIARIGLEAVEALESNQEAQKWTVAEIIAIRDKYRLKLKELKKCK